MKLKELLNEISPLPWSTNPEGRTNLIRDAKTSCVAMEATDCGDPISPENATYIVHVANSMKQLVESARAMVNALEHPKPVTGSSILTTIADFKAALENAENVKMPNNQADRP